MAELWPGQGGPAIDYISGPPPEDWRQTWPRGLAILGSTGSIGQNALAVLEAREEDFRVLGLSCARNVERLARQAVRWQPPFLAVLDEAAAARLKELLPAGYSPRILIGREGYARLAALPQAATVLSAQVGAAGLAGTLAAALAGKVICLANKESLVLAGGLVREICARTGATVLPVDSEHNALFQCLAGRGQEIKSLILTASGGPFRGKSREELRHVTPEQALKHPNWRMGAKISIDSASMMNKGLEVLEAFHLYGVPAGRIRVLVHPQSLVHSLVELADGSQLAQMGTADMRLAIAHCLLWPRCAPVGVAPLNLVTAGPLSFYEPDTKSFPCISLARRALAERGGLSVVLNAANEAAVELFLAGRCGFLDIPRLIDAAMSAHAATLPGHQPFCPPLRSVAAPPDPACGSLALEQEVRMLMERIEALDRHTRHVVHELAQAGAAAEARVSPH
ncbi:1-deoxy-D-xylulose-5-phosphate reductoisomerase [Desulfovibrio sp. ZJ200]|uniref:1-deoxy-D-xylulose-5-phosphate reductoisomerase n=1 Tax=Desulfovibrio sp. ZJ200 TaxID=2709792 RepID=UPI0013EBFE36|nr:1-deoxy-D-xylulose-5-phosphate reductoisomerase [Desulfovibrio sp. ZJ200]